MSVEPGSQAVSERAFIREMARRIESASRGSPVRHAVDPVRIGVGDDAAVLRVVDTDLVVSVDASIEGVHFRRSWFSWDDVGYRAMASALSDLAAMGAEPAWALTVVGLPDGFSESDARALAAGIVGAASEFGAHLVGGDTTRSPVVTLAVTVAGTPFGEVATRAGARPGDRLVVSRSLGASAAAVAWLSRPDADRPRSVEREAASVLGAYARFQPEFDWARRAVSSGVSAMIDVSDGVLIDAGHLAECSDLIVVVDAARVPVHPDAERVLDALGLEPGREALRSGEEYALLAAVPGDAGPHSHPPPGLVLGEFVAAPWHGFDAAQGRVLIRSTDGAIERPHDVGWSHFGDSTTG